MHIVYIFRHSKHNDEEIRYSLRSVARYAPWVRKVWIFGDRPAWISSDSRIIEHVPHDSIAWVTGYRTPVTSTFLLLYLIALSPEIESEFLLFADDYVLLRDLSVADAVKPRYLLKFNPSSENRGTGLFKEALCRTHDVLRRLKLPCLNYEVHVPVRFTKRQILAAIRDFRPYLSEDRFFSPLAKTAILNHAQLRENFSPVKLADEKTYAGFHREPSPYEEIVQRCDGKLFLNYDDEGFGPDMRRFVKVQFPQPCPYETGYTGAITVSPSYSSSSEERETPFFTENVSTITNVGLSAQESSTSSVITDVALGIPTPGQSLPSNEPSRCAVLVPYRGAIATACENGLQELERRGYVVRRIAGFSAIDRARCQIASDALHDGFEETLWIDSDVGFRPDDVDRLRRRGLPLCCGIYPKKGRRSLAAHVIPGTKEIVFGKKGGLIEVLYVGAGFLHVRREVYEQMIHRLGLPSCSADGKRPLVPFFQPLVRSRGESHWYLSEDFAFCHRARLCGIPIIADSTIRLHHIGESSFSWEEAGADRQRFDTYRYRLSSGSDGTEA